MAKRYNAVKAAEKNASQTFLKGAMILTASMIVVKMLGFVDKVLINNLFAEFDEFGDTFASFGSGLYSNAYEIYIPLFTIATAGFPIAISRLISESLTQKRYKDVKQIYRVSVPFFTVMGVICFLIMFVASFFYVKLISQPYALYGMLMLSPAILVGCFVSIYRGYFEGQRNMFPTAISEVFEAGGKLAFGYGIAYIILRMGKSQFESSYDKAARTCTVFGLEFSGKHFDTDAINTIISFSVVGAIAGIVLGSVLALAFLILRYKLGGDGIPEEYYRNSVDARTKKETFVRMFKTAIPIGLTALVMNIGTFLDTIIIQRVLFGLAVSHGGEIVAQYKAMGVELSKALSKNADDITIHTVLLGCYSVATPLMQLVTAVTQVFGTSAMPNVTSAWTKGDRKELKTSIESVIRLTMLFAIPASLGLVALANPIMDVVYKNDAQVIIGAQVLKVMGFAALVIACLTPVCSMLQGIGKTDVPLKLFIVGIMIKVVTTFLFVRIPSVNIQGGSMGSLVSHAFMLVAGMYLLVKYSGVTPDFVSTTVKPAVSAVLCAVSAYFSYKLFAIGLPMIAALAGAIFVAGIIYITALLLLRTFTRNELKFLPKGEKIVTILEKYKLIG